MDDNSKNTDRAILGPRRAYWADDPEQTLSEVELNRVLGHFGESLNTGDLQLRSSIKIQFQTFMVMAEAERLSDQDGRPEQGAKPTTKIRRELIQLREAGDKFYGQFANLGSVTKTWLELHFEATGGEEESTGRELFRDLDDRIFRLTEDLTVAARSAENIVTHGPNNMAQRIMVESLADCWEKCHGQPPTTDKGLRRRSDPFLELCQEMSNIAHARLLAKGGGFSTLQLTGLVNDVLTKRRSQSIERSREK